MTSLHGDQTGFGASPAPYSVDAGGSFPEGKTAEEQSWHYLHLVPRLIMDTSMSTLSYTSPWSDACLIKDNFAFT
jgi:hypothetical protein